MKSDNNKNALVLCGGGAQGAAEVGFYRALKELGIEIDLIIGTSVGSINGVFIASGYPAEKLKQFWIEAANRKLYSFNFQLLWKFGKASSIFKPTGLESFLNDSLPVETFDELEIPTRIVATNMQEAESVFLSEGKLVPALLASTAIPVYFPPRNLNGYQLIDGGITNNIPIKKADDVGVDSIYCLLPECRSRLKNNVQGLFNVLIRAAQVNQYQKLKNDLEQIDDRVSTTILDLCTQTTIDGLLDFSKTETIIEEAYEFSKKALQEGYACEIDSIP